MLPGKGETAALPRAGHSACFSISGRRSGAVQGSTLVKILAQPFIHCEIWQNVWCSLVQRGNVWKSMVQLLGIMQKKFFKNPVYGRKVVKSLAQPCTTQDLVKHGCFDPSLPS